MYPYPNIGMTRVGVSVFGDDVFWETRFLRIRKMPTSYPIFNRFFSIAFYYTLFCETHKRNVISYLV